MSVVTLLCSVTIDQKFDIASPSGAKKNAAARQTRAALTAEGGCPHMVILGGMTNRLPDNRVLRGNSCEDCDEGTERQASADYRRG